jgi:hypothetical protein
MDSIIMRIGHEITGATNRVMRDSNITWDMNQSCDTGCDTGCDTVSEDPYNNTQIVRTDWFADMNTVNLPFCETPYGLSPYIPQLASAAAHFPYIPLVLLGMLYCAPGIFRSDSHTIKSAKTMLWIQYALQTITCIGHITPNPRSFMIQEWSILATMSYLLFVYRVFTQGVDHHIQTTMIVAAVMIGGFFVIGLMPLIATTGVCIGATIVMTPGAFDRLTGKTRILLGGLMCITITELLFEEAYCSSLMAISTVVPWHLLFDLLFWQVIATIPPMVLLSDPSDGWLVA